MRSSSTLLTRLALALLALLGFVAPLATVEADRVVQTAGGKPSAVEVHEQATPRQPRAEGVSVLPVPAPPLAGDHHAVLKRYLLHRAWLL